MTIDNVNLINYYYMGYELSSDDAPFPVWFEFAYEKMACLLGYNDFTLQIHRDETEILEEVIKISK